MNFNQLQSKIDNAKDLDFGTIFNQSIELFKKVWGQGLLTIVIVIAMMIPFYFLMYVPLLAMGLMDPQSFEYGNEPTIAVIIPFVLYMILFVFFIMFVSFAIQAAFFRICKQKDLGLSGTEAYFYFFKGKYFSKIFVLSLAAVGIEIIAMLLCLFPLIYVAVPISLFSIVFAFNPELSASEIIKTSFALGNKKWFLIFGLTIVASFLAQIIGLMMCVVGIFVTASFVYLPLYHVYKEVIGFEETNEIEEIGDRLS